MASKHGYYARLYAREGVQLLVRNRFWSIVTGIVIALLLFVVYLMVAGAAHTREAARKVDDQLLITATVSQTPDTYKSVVPAARIAAQVKQIENVKAVRVVSETEARDRFVRNVRNLKQPPAAWVFAEALEISVTDTRHMEQVNRQVRALDGVEQSYYLQNLVRKLTAFSGYLRQIAVGGALLLGVIALLVVMAVVRTAMHSERRSVQIMSSVGGSPVSIALPLLTQMTIVCAVSALAACLAGYWFDPKISAGVSENIQDLPDWLRTGRAYGLLALYPVFFLASSAAVAVIVAWGTWRYTRTGLVDGD